MTRQSLTVEGNIGAQLLQVFNLVVASSTRDDLHAISLGELDDHLTDGSTSG